jgi:ATP-dependent DNA helicase RecG
VEPDRFIDEYRSRNEQLADLMRRLRICEEKGSGIDKVVAAAEFFQLPAPEFRFDSVRTTCVLFGPRRFEEMGRDDRMRACYQHCCLSYVLSRKVSNQSLRKRFGLSDARAETASRILRDTVGMGWIKPENPASGSKRFVSYLPYWA